MRRTYIALLALLALLVALPDAARAAPRAQSAAVSGWQKLNSPLEPGNYSRLAVHPTDARTLLLATSDGIYRSIDAGDTWTPLFQNGFSWEADFAPSKPERIYIQGYTYPAMTRTLLRSDDGGASWIELEGDAPFCGQVVAPSAADRVYAPPCEAAPVLYGSTDAGETWAEASLPFTGTVQALAVSPANPLHLLVADDRALYRSTDGAQTWQRVLRQPDVKRIFFHPSHPGLVYTAGWWGLTRSTNGGATWQQPTAHAYIYDIALWPAGDSLAAIHWGEEGKSGALWNMGVDAWQRQPFELPGDPYRLVNSLYDDSLLYLQAGGGELWRHAAPAHTWANPVFLPAVQRAAGAPGGADGAALARVNEYRVPMGAYPMALDAHISRAAENHAVYYALNRDDPSAMVDGPHREIPGKPGFTGRTPWDRCEAAGYPGSCGEDMHFLADPIASVDGWMATLYHRLPLISPFVTEGGYGLSTLNDHRVDVLDFSASATGSGGWVPAGPFLWVYPFPGQTGVPPAWNGYESPDPLPPDAAHPVGYTITVQAVNGELVVHEAALRDASGSRVAVHPNPADCTGNCYSIIAVAPLRPFTTYTVSLRGTLSGDSVEKTWQFTTGSASREAGADGAPVDESRRAIIGPPVELPEVIFPSSGRAEP